MSCTLFLFKNSRILKYFMMVMSAVAIVNSSHIRNFTFTICPKREDKPGNVLLEKSVRSQIDCATACALLYECRSATVTKSAGTRHCKLRSDWITNLDCGLLAWNDNSYFLNMNNPCLYTGIFHSSRTCACEPGFSGELCENPPKDCFFSSPTVTGIYPYGDTEKFNVYCLANNHTQIIKFIGPGGMPERNSTWATFKQAFGDFTYWWTGNQALHRITNSARYIMYMQVVTGTGYTELYYDNFVIDDEAHNYAVHFTQFNKTGLGDNTLTDGTPFSTKDNDLSGCAAIYDSAYWYADCSSSPLTGSYPEGGTPQTMYSMQVELIRMN